ncbi:hypothetical protein H4582DRAFT_2125285 [Lactarius indigo]|nr:hypothetical protein H4582DRAFT_2125285 [Lactarius indigo]
MAENSQATPSTNSYNFKVIFEAALKKYKEKTKQSLEGHTLLTRLEMCDSPTAVVDVLGRQVNANANGSLKTWLNPMIKVLYAFSATLGEGVSLMFPPTKMIFAGVGILLSAANDLNEDQVTIVDIFEQIESFFGRLEVYIEVPPTPMMKKTMVEIMAEVLNILAIVTKEIKQSPGSRLNIRISSLLAHVGPERLLKKLAGQADMKDAIKTLDRLTDKEARMASALIWKNTHMIDEKLTGVGNGVRFVGDTAQEVGTQVKNVRGEVQGVSNNVDDVKRSSSVPSPLIIDHLTQLQGTSYGRA